MAHCGTRHEGDDEGVHFEAAASRSGRPAWANMAEWTKDSVVPPLVGSSIWVAR